jgi:hypothetical protein
VLADVVMFTGTAFPVGRGARMGTRTQRNVAITAAGGLF